MLRIAVSNDWVLWTAKRATTREDKWEIILSFGKIEYWDTFPIGINRESIRQAPLSLKTPHVSVYHDLEVCTFVCISGDIVVHDLNSNSSSFIKNLKNLAVTRTVWLSNERDILFVAKVLEDSVNQRLYYDSLPSKENLESNSILFRAHIIPKQSAGFKIETNSLLMLTPKEVHVVNTRRITSDHVGIIWAPSTSPEHIIGLRFSIISTNDANDQLFSCYIPVEKDHLVISPDKQYVAITAWRTGKNWVANSVVGIVRVDEFIKNQTEFHMKETVARKGSLNHVSVVHLPSGPNGEVDDIIGWDCSGLYFTEKQGFKNGTVLYVVENPTTAPYLKELRKYEYCSMHGLLLFKSSLFGFREHFSEYSQIIVAPIHQLAQQKQSTILSCTNKDQEYSNEALGSNVDFKIITWNVSPEITVEAAILFPLHYSNKKKYPTLFLIHGGPDFQWNPYFVKGNSKIVDCYALLKRNWICVLPNLRGSTGYGQQFRDSVKHGKWSSAMEDLLYGVRVLIEEYGADVNRICLYGWSFGGYLVSRALGEKLLPAHNDKPPIPFSCHKIVAGAPITNFMSLEGISIFPSFFADYFSSSIRKRFEIYKSESPILYLNEKGISEASVLLVHGDSDYMVPCSQSLELLHFLQQLGAECTIRILKQQNHYPYHLSNPMIWNAIRRDIITFLDPN